MSPILQEAVKNPPPISSKLTCSRWDYCVQRYEDSGVGKPPLLFRPLREIDVTENRLPHWQQRNVFVFVTWRLGDSLPQVKLDQWKEEQGIWLKRHPRPWDARTAKRYHKRFSRRIEDWLDQGSGSCILKDPVLAKVVADALRHFDGERYELASFVVMPNHVHVLFRPLGSHEIPKIVKSWKWFTARQINRRTGNSGSLLAGGLLGPSDPAPAALFDGAWNTLVKIRQRPDCEMASFFSSRKL